MPISKATLVPDIWRLFYDRIKNQVTTTTITGSIVVNVQTYDSNFSDRPFEDRTYYPTIVINTPSVPTDRFTSGYDKVDATIMLEVYTYQSESADRFIAQIQEAIETYRGTFADNGIRQVKFGDLQSDMALRGSIKVHVRRIPVHFKAYYTRTVAY